jgi:N-acetylmuramoyl-L-alanine amidase
MNIEEQLSPNMDDRPEDVNINVLVMHYTGMKTATDALQRMCDPAFKVSAHYIIYEDGRIVRLVPEDKRAWHAGISCWHGRASLNDTSIGIEIVNPGHEWGYRSFPSEQMESVLALSKEIMERHQIIPNNVVGHSDIAPTRKEDPGELFNWPWLAENGVGLWPKRRMMWGKDTVLCKLGDDNQYVLNMQKSLRQYGYFIRTDGYFGPVTEKIVKAYKRHFVPEHLNVLWDKLSQARIENLIEQANL